MEPDPQQNHVRNAVKYVVLGAILIVTEIATSLASNWGNHIKVKGVKGPIGPDDDNYFTYEDDIENDEYPYMKRKAHVFAHTFFMAPMLYAPQVFCLLLFFIINKTGCCRRTCNNNPAQDPAAAVSPVNGQTRPFRLRNRRVEQEMRYRISIFIFPAFCNYLATCLLYVGFTLTYSSSKIMLKGTIMFFTSLLSVAFLGRNMNPRMWIGVVVGWLGLTNLGITDYFYRTETDYDTNGIVAGDLLIVMAQIMYSMQAVWEQKILTRYTNLTILETIGYEGLVGFILSSIMLIPFSFINAGAFSQLPGHKLEDPTDAFEQMKNNRNATFIVIGMMTFNTVHYLIALMITKSHGATPRMVINSLAYATAWGIMLALGWESSFKWLYPGFALVLIGFLIYFDLFFMQIFQAIKRFFKCNTEEDSNPLLGGENGVTVQNH